MCNFNSAVHIVGKQELYEISSLSRHLEVLDVLKSRSNRMLLVNSF